jgi:hypothetical protein
MTDRVSRREWLAGCLAIAGMPALAGAAARPPQAATTRDRIATVTGQIERVDLWARRRWWSARWRITEAGVRQLPGRKPPPCPDRPLARLASGALTRDISRFRAVE